MGSREVVTAFRLCPECVGSRPQCASRPGRTGTRRPRSSAWSPSCARCTTTDALAGTAHLSQQARPGHPEKGEIDVRGGGVAQGLLTTGPWTPLSATMKSLGLGETVKLSTVCAS